MSKLIINLDEDYKIKVESGKEFSHSIFKEVYELGADKVLEIINNNIDYNNTHLESSDTSDYVNNIIAFTGERGKGKSSSMISFRNVLNNIQDNKDLFNGKLSNFNFTTLNVIDPSFIRGNECLFEIVLAQMFAKFESEIKQKNTINDNDKRDILRGFHDVYENLQILNSDSSERYKLESIETLKKLSTSINLRASFSNLVNLYLKCVNQGFLLITIDDFDLKFDNVYEMLEDIRQFLTQQKILILVACKIEQLTHALKDKFSSTQKGGHSSTDNDVKNRAVKYLDKLIPFGRRIYLPSFDEIVSEEFVILKGGEVINIWGKSIDDKKDIETLISRLLFKNFDILLTKNEYRLNSIIPKTIREAQALFRVLVSNGDDKYYILKNYILQEVGNKDICVDYFEEIDSCYDSQLNLRIIRKIRAVLKNKGYDYQDEASIMPRTSPTSYLDDLADSKVPRYVSVGDVISAFIILENQAKIDDPILVQFIDYLKLYYITRISLKSPDERKIFSKYGFFSGYPIILRKSKSIDSRRDFLRISLKSEQFTGSNHEKYILGTMLYSLGKVNLAFRYQPSYDRYISKFEYGTFSPLSLFSNYDNVDELNNVLSSSETSISKDQFVLGCKKNIESSKLYAQFYNPYFLTTLFFEMDIQSEKLFKGGTTDNIFDEFLGIFIASFWNSLKEIEKDYKNVIFADEIGGDGLYSREFVNIPIIQILCRTIMKDNNNDLKRTRFIKEIKNIVTSYDGESYQTDYSFEALNDIFQNFDSKPTELKNSNKSRK